MFNPRKKTLGCDATCAAFLFYSTAHLPRLLAGFLRTCHQKQLFSVLSPRFCWVRVAIEQLRPPDQCESSYHTFIRTIARFWQDFSGLYEMAGTGVLFLQRDTPLNLRSHQHTLSQDLLYTLPDKFASLCTATVRAGVCSQYGRKSQREQFHHLVPKSAASSANTNRQPPTTDNTILIPFWHIFGCQHVLCVCHGSFVDWRPIPSILVLLSDECKL